MDVHDTRRERLRQLLREFSAADLSRRSGIAPSLISRYKDEPDKDGAKNLGEENARKLEKAAGKPLGWLDKQHSHAGPSPAAGSVAHDLSQWKPEHAPLVIWGDLMRADQLPPLFWVALPDDSMAPRAPAGRRICFETKLAPKPGDGVLVKDSSGGVYFRLYRGGAAERWVAHALNPAFHDLDSERDGLEVIAVLKAEEGRWG